MLPMVPHFSSVVRSDLLSGNDKVAPAASVTVGCFCDAVGMEILPSRSLSTSSGDPAKRLPHSGEGAGDDLLIVSHAHERRFEL
jgi:hypothetical protein